MARKSALVVRLLALLFLFSFPFSFANSVRNAGLGGTILPGPSAAAYNPAYAAMPDPFPREAWSVPVGLLGFLLPDRSPLYYFIDPNTFISSFDLLSAFDQLTHLDSFLINPAKSPDEVRISIDASGITLTDGQGNPINLNFFGTQSNSTRESRSILTPSPLLQFPLSTDPNFSIDLGIFAGLNDFGINPNSNLISAILNQSLQADATYTLEASATASAGVNLDFTYAGALPVPLPLGGEIYLGARGRTFLGLAYADAKTTVEVTTDNNGLPNGSTQTTDAFYVVPGQGYGYGGQVDAGVAIKLAGAVVGFGVTNLMNMATWQGQQQTFNGTTPTSTPVAKTLTFTGSAPQYFVNGAVPLPLGPMGSILVAADASLDASGTTNAHAGIEYDLGPMVLRGGVGLENGTRFGLGAGFDLGGSTIDLALTTHSAPISGETVYGIAMSVGF